MLFPTPGRFSTFRSVARNGRFAAFWTAISPRLEDMNAGRLDAALAAAIVRDISERDTGSADEDLTNQTDGHNVSLGSVLRVGQDGEAIIAYDFSMLLTHIFDFNFDKISKLLTIS